MRKSALAFLLLYVMCLQAFSAAGRKEVRIRLTEAATYIVNETKVDLDFGVRQYSSTEDGLKIFDSTSSAPNLYSFTGDGVPCFSNSYGAFTPNMIVPLGFKVAGNGNYTFDATLIDNFDATSIVRLEDRTAGMFYDLRKPGGYTITLNQPTQDDNRFFLHVSFPALIGTVTAGCANNDGAISVSQDNSIIWTSCLVLDDTLGTVYNNNYVTGNFAFGNLPSGNYGLMFSYGNYSVIKPVHVNGENIISSMNASTIYATTGQSIQFFGNATNTSNYLWDFGDGSEIAGVANPDFSYMLPGTYTVTLTCTNIYGCSSTSTITVYISQATGIEPVKAGEAYILIQDHNLLVRTTQTMEKSQNMQVLNQMGQLIRTGVITQGENNFDLGELSSGVYIVRIHDGTQGYSRKIILP